MEPVVYGLGALIGLVIITLVWKVASNLLESCAGIAIGCVGLLTGLWVMHTAGLISLNVFNNLSVQLLTGRF
jgi:hypothetical protein